MAISVGVLAICVYLVWPSSAEEKAALRNAWTTLDWGTLAPYVAGYLASLVVVHFCRSYRWKYLLAALKTELPLKKVVAINSVGYMAVLLLPIRLGEFVRPVLFRKHTGISASAGLGAVAVERVMDGLLVSTFVFVTFMVLKSPDSPNWMLPTAAIALSVFAAGFVFLLGSLLVPEFTAKWSVRCTLTPWVAPNFSKKIEGFVKKLISGFQILKDRANLFPFVFWTILYWLANGFGMWFLAVGLGEATASELASLPLLGAYATMGLLAVGLMIPNAPGMAGQFQAFVILGLSLFIPEAVAQSSGLIYGILIHISQFVWYIGIGGLFLMTPLVSFGDIYQRKSDEETTTSNLS